MLKIPNMVMIKIIQSTWVLKMKNILQKCDLFFNAITGPNGEKISFEKIDTCCPFPSKKSVMGAGTLDLYEVKFEGSDKKSFYTLIYTKEVK